MSVYETFAKRKRQAENADKPVIYSYDTLPRQFRVQVVQILTDTIGDPATAIFPDVEQGPNQRWAMIHDTMAKEMGEFRLVRNLDPKQFGFKYPCAAFILNTQEVDDVLSLIELAFLSVEQTAEKYPEPSPFWGTKQAPDDAISELNRRFREHSIGYQYQAGQIVRVDSLYLHSEAVEPAISLLHDQNFEGALQEFMDAHRHYREQRYKEAIANCGSAFESTMKAICDLRGWIYNPKRATASTLIEVLFNKDLIPAELKSHFTSLRTTLESGLPPVRNQAGRGAHGQGATSVDVPDYLAAYCLHLAASNIVFLVEAHNAKG